MPDVTDPNRDRLYKVREFFDKVNSVLMENYTPGEFLSADESLIPCKSAKAYFKQYMPKKRYGILS